MGRRAGGKTSVSSDSSARERRETPPPPRRRKTRRDRTCTCLGSGGSNVSIDEGLDHARVGSV